MANKKVWGVVIGRFQTPYLSNGHRYLIETVFDKHESVLILIGVHQSQPTNRNPLDFWTRCVMIQKMYPKAIVVQIDDHLDNNAWSQNVDALIRNWINDNNAILYGSRDSFIKYYSGKFKVEEIKSPSTDNSTAFRAAVAKEALANENFRRGVIYGISSRIPSPYICVDVAVINGGSILLGKKTGEPAYRFIGGFVDATDDSITAAAKRELHEEAGHIEVGSWEIIGESKIDDWRYRSDEEKIFTVFYKCHYQFGQVKPGDDMNFLEWLPIGALPGIEFINEHQQLKKILLNNLKETHFS